MPDSSAPPITGAALRRAHETARAVHDALLALGIPETVLGPLTARQDSVGGHRVLIPPLPIADAERLLIGLGPYLGPGVAAFVGRADAAPYAPADRPA